METLLLDAAEIARDWEKWHPIGRAEAMSACMYRPVAVIFRGAGLPMAERFHPGSRFYRSVGPYLFEGLRYFVYTGASMRALKGLRGTAPLEESGSDEAETDIGEPIPLGSPESKVPPSSRKAAASLAAKLASPDLPVGPKAHDKPKNPIEIAMIDADGKALAGASFTLILPDGTEKSGKTDDGGFIRLPDNTQTGDIKVLLV